MADVLGSKPTKEQIEEGLKLLVKKLEREEKVRKGELKPSYKKVAEMTPQEKAKYQEQNRRYSLYVKLTLEKAKKAGVEATKAEVDAAMAK